MARTIKKIKSKTARMVVKHRMSRKGKLTLAQDKIRRKRMSCLILTIAFLLLVIPSYIVLQYRFNSLLAKENLTEQKQEIYTMGMVIYRHTNAYPLYCKKAGYDMIHYSKTFMSENEPDLIAFHTAAQQLGLHPDMILNQMRQGFSTVVQKSIGKEFKRWRERGIVTAHATPVQTDEAMCRYIDENAALWLKTEKKADMEKLHEFVKTITLKNE